MLQFPLGEFLDEQKCYEFLKGLLHSDSFRCPCGYELPTGPAPHKRQKRRVVVNYRCRVCGKVFNIFTDTLWSGSSYPCSQIVLLLHGFSQGTPTLHLAQELGLDYKTLLERRPQLQGHVFDSRPQEPLTDEVVEADEMFQNAGEKGTPPCDPKDPPRRRANQQVGKGTMNNDRPPVFGVVGRTSGQIRWEVCEDTKQKTIQPQVEKKTEDTTTLYTDDSSAYNKVAQTGRTHATVKHSHKEWARDDDGDGVREVHSNTMEGTWTGLRNFLRPFRGVHKRYLHLYVVMFEWAHNLKTVTEDFLRALMISGFTSKHI